MADKVTNFENLFLTALNFSSIKCLEYMEKKVDKESLSKSISLHNLCKGGKVGSLRIALKFMENKLMDRNEDGKIPLQLAAENERNDVVNFLLGYDYNKYFLEG